MLTDFIQSLQNVLIVAAGLVPAFQSLFDASCQLPSLFEQLPRATSYSATGTGLVGSAALQAIELFCSCLEPFCQLHDQGVFGTHLVHECGDLLST